MENRMRKRMTVILNSKMNMRRFYVSAALLLTTLLAVAENNPYRSDVFWVTVPDHADWLYKTGEQANVEVQFYKYGIPGDSIAINFEIGGEMMPADFQQFWENEKVELAKFPLTYTKEHVKKYSTDQIDCYLIKLQVNQRGQSIYGYLFYPKKEGKYPVVLCPPGAGIKTIKEPLRHKYYAEQGCIRFEIEIHGLNPEMSEEEFKEISAAFNGRENGYLSNGLDSRDNYYMKRVYLACVRSIDLLTSLPEWDGKNVIVQGGSQGGALALVTAGLDQRVTACVANHPALSDMAGYKAGRAGGYPHFFRNTVDMDTPEKIRTMAYYDVVNFAQLIRADTYMTWGFNDDVCPPTTSYIVYNVLNCPKEALITPINEHWTSSDTEYGHLLWIKKHLK